MLRSLLSIFRKSEVKPHEHNWKYNHVHGIKVCTVCFLLLPIDDQAKWGKR